MFGAYSRATAASLLGLLVPGIAVAQTSTLPPDSEAYGISATFTADGMSTSLGPVANVSGTTPPYSKTVSVASYNQSIAVPPLVPAPVAGSASLPVIYPIVATFQAVATGLTSHVAASFGVDTFTATGTSKVANATLNITSSGPPDSATPVELWLGVTASKSMATADYSEVFVGPTSVPKVSGSASFGSLSISGALLGGQTIQVSGAQNPNTILFQSPTVTITANQQIIAALITCDPACHVLPSSTTVHGLDIALNNAPILGRPVSGEIVLGDGYAH